MLCEAMCWCWLLLNCSLGTALGTAEMSKLQELRQVLITELGERCAQKFTDAHLKVLVDAGYQDADDLRDACKSGRLELLGLPEARMANLQARFQGMHNIGQDFIVANFLVHATIQCSSWAYRTCILKPVQSIKAPTS